MVHPSAFLIKSVSKIKFKQVQEGSFEGSYKTTMWTDKSNVSGNHYKGGRIEISGYNQTDSQGNIQYGHPEVCEEK